MKKRGKNEKGVSPIITTVLLIVIVIILAMIIFLWASRFIGEKIEKFDKPIESVCNDVDFRASISGSELLLVNRGNVPIYGVNVKKQKPGTSQIEEKIVELNKGDSKNESISFTPDTESIIVIPVLLGKTSGKETKKFTCPEEYGFEIEV